MRIHAKVCGYYDWTPCPPGTEITDADIKALRVKQMTDTTWHMKVCVDANTTHDAGVPEDAICRRLATFEKLGRPTSREEAVVELLRKTFEHHLDIKHIVDIEVEDDGPNADLYATFLEAAGVTDPEAVAAAQDRYDDETDMGAYLNVVFKSKTSRKTKVPAKTPTKETP